jgi:hypothetical protein
MSKKFISTTYCGIFRTDFLKPNGFSFIPTNAVLDFHDNLAAFQNLGKASEGDKLLFFSKIAMGHYLIMCLWPTIAFLIRTN